MSSLINDLNRLRTIVENQLSPEARELVETTEANLLKLFGSIQLAPNQTLALSLGKNGYMPTAADISVIQEILKLITPEGEDVEVRGGENLRQETPEADPEPPQQSAMDALEEILEELEDNDVINDYDRNEDGFYVYATVDRDKAKLGISKRQAADGRNILAGWLRTLADQSRKQAEELVLRAAEVANA